MKRAAAASIKGVRPFSSQKSAAPFSPSSSRRAARLQDAAARSTAARCRASCSSGAWRKRLLNMTEASSAIQKRASERAGAFLRRGGCGGSALRFGASFLVQQIGLKPRSRSRANGEKQSAAGQRLKFGVICARKNHGKNRAHSRGEGQRKGLFALRVAGSGIGGGSQKSGDFFHFFTRRTAALAKSLERKNQRVIALVVNMARIRGGKKNLRGLRGRERSRDHQGVSPQVVERVRVAKRQEALDGPDRVVLRRDMQHRVPMGVGLAHVGHRQKPPKKVLVEGRGGAHQGRLAIVVRNERI